MRCFGLITFLLLLSFPAYSQIYRVQDSPAPQEEAFKNSAWEVSAGAFVSSASLCTAAGKTVSHGEVGISARALYALNNWVSLGVEGGLPRASDTEAVLEKYQVWRVGAVGKFSVTKGTSPRAYILAGVGAIGRRAEMLHFLSAQATNVYFTAGWGLEWVAEGGWFAGVEVYGTYDQAPHIGPYFYVPHRWTAGAQLQVGFKF